MDEKFAALKSLLASNPKVEDVQAVFNALGQEVEKAYVAPAPSASDIAAIVKSAVEDAVAPLKIQLATLQAQKSSVTQSQNQHPVSRALSLKPAELVQKSDTRKLTQIERIAKSSVGVAVEQ